MTIKEYVKYRRSTSGEQENATFDVHFNFENEDNIEIINIDIDVETKIPLVAQVEFEEIPLKQMQTNEVLQQKYEKPSTVGIGKHCKNCNKAIDYDKKICPFCGQDSNTSIYQDNKTNYFIIFVVIFLATIIFMSLAT